MSPHILLVGERRDRVLFMVLMLEQYDFLVTVQSDPTRVQDIIRAYRADDHPVEMLVIGSFLSDYEIWDLFQDLKHMHVRLPFILNSDRHRAGLIRRLLNEGFCGYRVPDTEPIHLINRIQLLLGLKNNEVYSG